MLKIELANKDLSSKILSKGTLEPWQCYQLCCLAPADFGRSVNPIQTRGADYAHYITTWHPRLQNLNTSPDNNILTLFNIERGEKSLCK